MLTWLLVFCYEERLVVEILSLSMVNWVLQPEDRADNSSSISRRSYRYKILGI